ncbi:prepilin-type N-terminal cleavage/methylation domain-containing protein [Acinetobacter johnsonii]|uniref:PilW family protein n=1 Tax=Acinetobacter johnsonii TaxID=40214 RepID=UPI001329D723|nr:PilW family protein [Acinetobacter johnsonii]MWC18713.1 prepilin-type N-terminal cleavage/methylation domain-containing protein [Acinetobacter johnsonii]
MNIPNALNNKVQFNSRPQTIRINSASGFTLIELMVALSLGLLIVAAATHLYLTAQRGMVTQQGAANLQNSASFGMEYMLRDIRLANLGASKPSITPDILHGGVVLSHKNLSTASSFTIKGQSTNTLMTQGGVGPSNLDGENSDQLVIQYHNADVTGSIVSAFDCEGNALPSDAYVVERYFLRADTNRNDPNQPLALACKATSYSGDSPSQLAGLQGNGEIIIPRVDHMRILLGVASDTFDATQSPAVAGTDGVLDRFGYIGIENYKNLTDKPQIVSIQIGLLARSPDTVGKNDLVDVSKKTYRVLDVNKKLKSDSKNDLYNRLVVTQTVALRNGFGLQENPQ